MTVSVCDQPLPLRMGLCHTHQTELILGDLYGQSSHEMCSVQAILATDRLPRGTRVKVFS